jgi:hypothetical protein
MHSGDKRGLGRQAAGLLEAGFVFTSKELLGFDPCDVFLAMGEDYRIDPLATAHAMPVEGLKFVDLLRDHETAATVATIHANLLSNRCL